MSGRHKWEDVKGELMKYKVGDEVYIQNNNIKGIINQIFEEDLPEPIYIIENKSGQLYHRLQGDLYPIIKTENSWLKCTKCNTPLKPEFVPELHRRKEDQKYLRQVDDGMEVKFIGGYGMFYDQDGHSASKHTALLCHDCMVDLLKFFSEEFRNQFKGGHPYDHKPNGKCCEYAWSFEDEEQNE